MDGGAAVNDRPEPGQGGVSVETRLHLAREHEGFHELLAVNEALDVD
jgi:hypothetical protein